jgi:hypothetical protein
MYRLGLWWMDWKKPCSCLGNLTDALHISPQTADNITKVLLAYLLIGSYGLLLWQWKQRCTKTLIYLIGFLLLSAESQVEASLVSPVVYEGTITKSVVGPDGNPVPSTESTYSFRAEIALPLYRISVVAIKDLSCFEQVAGTDGVDSYLLQKGWPSWKDKSADTGRKEAAQVTPGLFPTLAVPEIQLVWTMLAYQKGITNEQPIVLSHISYAPYDELKMNVQYAENGNLDLVEVFSSGYELVQGQKYPLPVPFEKGYKLWEFSVTDAGKQNAFSFPQKGTFQQYSVFSDDPPGKSGKLRCVRQIQIVVTNASEIPAKESDFLPVLGRTNLMATDYRFSHKIPRPYMGEVGVIQYRLRENKWLNRSNKIVTASGVSLKVETQMANVATNKPSGRRLAILVLLVICSAGVVFFITKKRQHL